MRETHSGSERRRVMVEKAMTMTIEGYFGHRAMINGQARARVIDERLFKPSYVLDCFTERLILASLLLTAPCKLKTTIFKRSGEFRRPMELGKRIYLLYSSNTPTQLLFILNHQLDFCFPGPPQSCASWHRPQAGRYTQRYGQASRIF